MVATQAEGNDLRLSAVAVQTFAALVRRPLETLLIGGIFVYAPYLLSARVFPDPGADIFTAEFARWWMQTLVAGSPSVIFAAWIALVAAEAIQGGGRSHRASLFEVFRRFFPLILLSVLLTVIGVLAMLLLILPGIIWMLATTVATPALMVERLGPVAATKRSIDLTRNRWALILVYSIVLFLPFVGLSMLLDNLVDPALLVHDVRPVADSIVTIIGAAFAAAIYCELRRLSEARSTGSS